MTYDYSDYKIPFVRFDYIFPPKKGTKMYSYMSIQKADFYIYFGHINGHIHWII